MKADLSTGRPTLNPGRFDPSAPRTAARLEAVDRFVALTDEVGCSLPELATAFPLAHPAVTSVIIGPRTMEQLRNTLKGASVVLDDAALDRIDEIVPPGTDVYPPDGVWTRRSFSALPTIVSDSPAEYMSAVSTKLTPSSSAAWMIRTESS